MVKYPIIVILCILASCRQGKGSFSKEYAIHTCSERSKMVPTETFPLTDKTEKFQCQRLSEPERAALGYVVTFVGSECEWDGEAKNDFSNLRCKVLGALDLGYQCSDQHLDFLRHWFRKDNEVLRELQDCPTVPYTANNQNTFDYIHLKVIINLKMGEGWSWTETDHFQLERDHIKLAKKDKSPIRREHFEIAE